MVNGMESLHTVQKSANSQKEQQSNSDKQEELGVLKDNVSFT